MIEEHRPSVDYFCCLLPTALSVNSLFVNVRGRKRGRIRHKRYEEWIYEADRALSLQNPLPVFTEPVAITLHHGKRARADLDNLSKAPIDRLVAWGIIPDDSKQWLKRLAAEWDDTVNGCLVEIQTMGARHD